jgi:hypothetical protein
MMALWGAFALTAASQRAAAGEVSTAQSNQEILRAELFDRIYGGQRITVGGEPGYRITKQAFGLVEPMPVQRQKQEGKR